MNKDCKWVRLSLRQLCRNMAGLGCSVSPTTIGRLLKDNDYALRANVKSKEPGSNHPERNTQFEYIKQTKEEFLKKGLPIISIDTKKKELIGNFKNDGCVWGKEAETVKSFRSISTLLPDFGLVGGTAFPFSLKYCRHTALLCFGCSRKSKGQIAGQKT